MALYNLEPVPRPTRQYVSRRVVIDINLHCVVDLVSPFQVDLDAEALACSQIPVKFVTLGNTRSIYTRKPLSTIRKAASGPLNVEEYIS